MIDRIKEYYYNNKILVIGFSFFVLFFICSLILIYNKFENNKNTSEIIDDVVAVTELQNEVESDKTENMIKVDIKGNVVNPGVYELVEGSRVIDLINAASGLNSAANTDYINLSKELKNEMVIYIYSNDEIKEFYENNVVNNKTCICEERKNDACTDIKNDNGNYITEEIINDSNDNSETKLININSATIEELKTLNGIGESKAKAIIEFREENGKFSDISEITKVSGISEAIFAKIKENITV